MKPEAFENENLPARDLVDVSRTIASLPHPTEGVGKRLQYLAALLAKAGALPSEPLLLWRELDTVRHHRVGKELVVGRIPIEGLALGDDKLLSRQHFKIQNVGGSYRLADLNSHNGTVVNELEMVTGERTLHDGDLVSAGKHIFAFLDQRKVT